MPAWLHHPVEKSHHSTWKYHQSSKYNERVFLIFHDPMHPLSSPSHMHFLKQYCQYEDPLKLVRSPWGRAQISVFFLGRCSPYSFKKKLTVLKGLLSKGFQWVCKECQCVSFSKPHRDKNHPPPPPPSVQPLKKSLPWVERVSFKCYHIRLWWGSEQTVAPNLVPRFLTPCKMVTSYSLVACERQTFLLAAEGRFTRRNVCGSVTEIPYWWCKICPEIWSEALIGRRSSFIVLAIVYEWQIKDKRRQRSNVNTMNLKQNSQYLWNIVFSSRSIWVLLELIHRWTQHLSKIDQEKRKIGQIYIWNTMTTGFIM